MKELKPGDVFMKDGTVFDIHLIKKGFVYFQMWPKGVEEQELFDNCYRLKIETFMEDFRDFKHINKPVVVTE